MFRISRMGKFIAFFLLTSVHTNFLLSIANTEFHHEISESERTALWNDEQDAFSDWGEDKCVFRFAKHDKDGDIFCTLLGLFAMGYAAYSFRNVLSDKARGRDFLGAVCGAIGIVPFTDGLSRLATLNYSNAPLLTLSKSGVEFNLYNERYTWDKVKVTLEHEKTINSLYMSGNGYPYGCGSLIWEEKMNPVKLRFDVTGQTRSYYVRQEMVDDFNSLIHNVKEYSSLNIEEK